MSGPSQAVPVACLRGWTDGHVPGRTRLKWFMCCLLSAACHRPSCPPLPPPPSPPSCLPYSYLLLIRHGPQLKSQFSRFS